MWLQASGHAHLSSPHPNRLAFDGVLVRCGVPSDAPPNGSGGRRVILTREAAERALPTLQGMGVNLTTDLSGHNVRAKVGVIEAASMDGDAIRVRGVIWSGDHPAEAAQIALRQADLGFSFEALNVAVEDQNADPLRIIACQFTGASILLKAEAAFQNTLLSLAASRTRGKTMNTDDVPVPRPLLLHLQAAGITGPDDRGVLSEEQLNRLLENKRPGDRIEIKAACMAAGIFPRTLRTFTSLPPIGR